MKEFYRKRFKWEENMNLNKMNKVAQLRKMVWKRQLRLWLSHLQYVVVSDIKVPI
jgi:hypothetical protein